MSDKSQTHQSKGLQTIQPEEVIRPLVLPGPCEQIVGNIEADYPVFNPSHSKPDLKLNLKLM